MKKTLLIIPVAILFVILLASFGGGDPNLDYPSGAPAGYTGSPADGQDCSDCHGGTATTATGIITSNIPGSGYVAGTAYTITVTLTGSVGKGFEVSPQNASGTLLGTLTAGSNNHITGTKYVTHNAKITTSPAVWNFTWTAPAAGTGQVTFYGAFTLSKPVTKLSTLVVNEGTPAPVTANATSNPASIIQGATSQLNVTATGGTGSYSYSWTSNPAGFTSNLQNPVVTPSVTTIYTAHVTSGSQSVNANTTVTVTPLLTAAATATPSSVVAGSTSQLNVNPTGGTGTYTYSWTSNPAGFTSNLQNPVVTPSVTTIYTAHVTSGSQSVNSTATVTVIPLLTATASATPASITEGSTSQLNATPAGGTGSYTYSWTSNPVGFTSSLKNPVVTPAVNTVYTVQVTSGTQDINSDVSVTVIPLLSANATATPSSIVPGGSSQLEAIATGGTGTYTYSWISDPPGFTSSIANPVVSPGATTVYTVTISSGSQSATANTTLIVSTNLVANATADPPVIVAGGMSQLQVTTSGGTSTETYLWSSDPPGFSSTLQNPQVTPVATTVYSVVVTNGSQTASASTTVTVFDVLSVTASALPSTINIGETSQLSASPAGGDGSYTYLWTSDPAGFTSVEQNPQVSPEITTIYTVEVTSGSQTSTASATVTVDGPTGIGNIENTKLTVSPNPSSGAFCIELTTEGSDSYKVTIYDLSGKIIMNQTPLHNGKNSLNLSGQPAGIYLISVRSGNFSKIIKLILQ